jgi:hypothetical protein
MNPPSGQGWHTGKGGIGTGILAERSNFGAGQVGDVNKPGIRRIVERLRAQGTLSPEAFVDGCLDLIGPMTVAERTHEALVGHARKAGPLDLASGGKAAEARVAEMLQMIVATREFQWV